MHATAAELESQIAPVLEDWEDRIVPGEVEILPHTDYSPGYAWMYTYEKHLKRRIEKLLGRPLGEWERRLFGADGAFSEGLSNAFVHAHRRNPAICIRVRCVVGPQGLLFTIRDQGPGFDVEGALTGVERGRTYFSVAGNGLRALVAAPSIGAAYEDGGRTLHLLIQFAEARGGGAT